MRRRPHRRSFAPASVEPCEPRRLLADVGLLTTTADTDTVSPSRSGSSDGSGNKIIALVNGVTAFRTSTFSRVETSRQILQYYNNFGSLMPDPSRNLTLACGVYRDVNANKGFDSGDTLVTNVASSQTLELDTGSYLYVITPTSGDAFTTVDIKVTLRAAIVSGSKANLTGTGVAIADGDTTPGFADNTDFGTVPVGVINNDRVYTVRNTGGSSLTLGAVRVPAGFVVKTGLPGLLAPGRIASFTIGLATATAGTFGGGVSFTTNDASAPSYNFNVTGVVSATALPAKSGLQRLRINGTNGGDTIVLTQNSTRVIFSVNGNLYSVRKNKIRRGISVDAFTGDDSISVAADITLPVLIVGGAGNDTLVGGGGADTLLGFEGADVLRGGIGADSLDGGDGSDTADYSDRTAALNIDNRTAGGDGEAGENDTVTATVENVLGGSGNDTIVGGGEGNSFAGGGGNDFLLGNGGDDSLNGGGGKDTLKPGLGRDTLVGGASQDTADYSDHTAALKLSNDNVGDDGQSGENDNIRSDVERLIGGSGNDVIDVFSDGAVAFGLGGDDLIRGTDGVDALFGGDGEDSIVGFGGGDYIQGDDGDDFLSGLRGNDTITGGNGDDNITGDSDDDTLSGDAGNDTIDGGQGADSIHGGAGNDALSAFTQNAGSGTPGIDRLFGDEGDDTLTSDSDVDGLADIFDGGPGTDSIASSETVDIILNVP